MKIWFKGDSGGIFLLFKLFEQFSPLIITEVSKQLDTCINEVKIVFDYFTCI